MTPCHRTLRLYAVHRAALALFGARPSEAQQVAAKRLVLTMRLLTQARPGSDDALCCGVLCNRARVELEDAVPWIRWMATARGVMRAEIGEVWR